MSRQLFPVVCSVFIAALALTACGTKEVVPATKVTTPEVPCTHVVQMTLSRVDQLPGEIRAYQDVQVYPKVPGFIKWIGVDRGSKVKAGQPMVRLEAPELKAQTDEFSAKTQAATGRLSENQSKIAVANAMLKEAQAQFAGDNDTYTRTNEASKVPGVVAPNDLIVLEQKVQADREKVQACQESISAAQNLVVADRDSVKAAKKSTSNYQDMEDYLNINAPFDGFVTERNMHVGSFVGPRGQGAYPPIITVQQLGLLRIITPVPEVDVGGVTNGAKVDFTVSTHPGEKFVGTVARLGNYLDQKTRTMPVELSYENPDWRILPGMFCEVLWPTTRKKPTLFVPSQSVNETSTLETFVTKIDANNEVVWVKVKRGQSMNGMTEVFGDLKAGETVAIKADDALKPKTKVVPKIEKVDDAKN